jgi:hypothetical protein
LIYFDKVYHIELKRPNGSNDIQREYYKNELNNPTHFFMRIPAMLTPCPAMLTPLFPEGPTEGHPFLIYQKRQVQN